LIQATEEEYRSWRPPVQSQAAVTGAQALDAKATLLQSQLDCILALDEMIVAIGRTPN
jgi:hypothetical protein